ncbi:transglutaminase-like domain-containing protein [Maridesulfovibrio bastinii]|uniref:transglutaminase-like domain-containing protein n=1 Tax=Maridesulfovibrio bastinii TaxID=47157 RepID=UPI0004281BA3|nr:transglutaminase-like domain-containing protein [Maridesulfovibrio bastinii]
MQILLKGKKSALILIPLILAVALLNCGCAGGQHKYNFKGWSPENSSIDFVLETSGSNSKELQKVLDTCKGYPEKMQCAKFLIANLPPGDRSSIKAETLIDNINFALLARRTMPWGKDVSWSDFLHYVLPHRVSQEKACNWRRPFFKEIMPLVASCKDINQAILKINRWCFEKTDFKSTQRWDQSPSMTINRGVGRCEEAVILLVCALRSAGIPARQAMVPAWQHTNDNHTWTEVLTGTGWHYLESANPTFGLDQAWFSESVRKAPLIMSYAYGDLKYPVFPVIKKTFGCTVLNTTAKYAPVSPMRITVVDEDNKPVSGPVYISVYNYGSFAGVLALKTDSNGKTEIKLGPGSVLISTSLKGKSAFKFSTWIPGKQKCRAAVNLKLNSHDSISGQHLLGFNYADLQSTKNSGKKTKGIGKTELNKIRGIRNKKFEAIKKSALQFNKAHADTLARAGLNLPEILYAATSCPPEDLSLYYKMLDEMATADLCSYTAEQLLKNLLSAIQARKEASASGITYSDEIFLKYVLNPRIKYEQPSHWREILRHSIKPENRTPAAINTRCSLLEKIPRGPLGCALTPVGIINSGCYSEDSEKRLFAVAALRSFGIPARDLAEQNWIEFYNGKKWKPMYPDHPELLGQFNATEKSSFYYGQWPKITFDVSQMNKNDRYPEYFKDFTLSKVVSGVLFKIVENSISGGYNTENHIWEMKVPQGDYWLIYGVRNKAGEPLVTIESINTHK